ncbi:MAG: DUF2231 domain-containing protein [Firmicutes bacterium]|nr:DUF2231 domain-containing protein [Bacillota bacterium]
MQNIHPLFVHFPIALLSVALLCDLLGKACKKDSLNNAGWWLQFFGTIAIIATAITGLIASNTVKLSDEARDIMEDHETLELIAGGIFALLFIWRSISKTILPKKVPLLITYFVIGALGAGIMFYGAHLGGRMVYEFGAGGSAVQQYKNGDHDDNKNIENKLPSPRAQGIP